MFRGAPSATSIRTYQSERERSKQLGYVCTCDDLAHPPRGTHSPSHEHATPAGSNKEQEFGAGVY